MKLHPRKMRFLLLFVALWLASISCDEAEVKTNKKMKLSEKQMTALIREIQITEAALNYNRNLGKQAEGKKEFYYDLVFKNHQVTPEIFRDNLKEYSKKPEVLESIYDSVIATVTQMQDSLKIDRGKE